MNIITRSLPPSCSSFDLMELFKPFGPVNNVRIVDDVGYISMLRKEDGIQAVNTLRNPYLKGRRVYIEADGNQYGRVNYPESNNAPPYNWMDSTRDIERSMEYPDMIPDRQPMRQDYVDSWRQPAPVPVNPLLNGARSEDLQPESYVYVDSHGYSRDPTMRPAPEYYFRIKMMDSNQKFGP